MNNEETLERIGMLVDKAENYLAMQKMNLPPMLAIDGLKQGVTEIRDELKVLYEDLGGDVEETWPLGDYE